MTFSCNRFLRETKEVDRSTALVYTQERTVGGCTVFRFFPSEVSQDEAEDEAGASAKISRDTENMNGGKGLELGAFRKKNRRPPDLKIVAVLKRVFEN